MRRLHLILRTSCVLAVAACGARPASDPVAADDVARIEAQGRRFSAAYMAGDIETMLSIYTPDAVIFPVESEMLRGDSLRAYWTVPAGQRITLHRSTPTEIRVDGDHAYEFGVYEVRGEADGAAWGPNVGKYVAVWRRTPEGWRMHLDIWNPRPRPASQRRAEG